MNPNVSFAKIVATPTGQRWSQAYNAGRLFAVVSLSSDNPPEDKPLNTLGKQVINNLEAEFFTLEKKDLPSIKSAVTTSLAELPDDVQVSFVLAFLAENVLYVLRYGPGKIIVKRGESIGVLLESTKLHEIHTASGYLQNDDIIILQTAQFSHLIKEDTLKKALELSLPNDIAETLNANVTEAEEGGASAIIISIKGVPAVDGAHVKKEHDEHNLKEALSPLHKKEEEEKKHEDIRIEKNEKQQEDTSDSNDEEEEKEPTEKPSFAVIKELRPKVSLSLPSAGMRTKIFLLLAVIIIAVLGITVYSTVKKQQEVKAKAAFTKLYQAAQKDYDEGIGLLALNPTFAREDLLSAKQKADEGLTQVQKDSEEEKQLQDLLNKINAGLDQTGQSKTVALNTATPEESPLLEIALAQNDVLAVAVEDSSYYAIDGTHILEFTDPSKTGKKIITNEEDWSKVKGLAAYNGNLYVLDTEEGLLKFVAGASGYGKNSYFTGANPDLSKAVDLAIDGSVWILLSNGQVQKYTKGVDEAFSIKGIDKALKNPTKIITHKDDTYIYILDSGNARVVQIQKDGTFKAQFQAPNAATAKAIDVNEDKKKLYLLDKGSVYSFDL